MPEHSSPTAAAVASDREAAAGRRRADLAAALVVLVQFVLRTSLAAQGAWTADDWGLLNNATTLGFGPENWFRAYGGQLHPLLWELFEFLQWVAPGSYATAAVVIGVLQAISVVLVYLVLRRIFGARLLVVAVIGWYALGPLTLESRLWTTVALYTVPFQIAFAATLLLFLRYLDRPDRRRTALVAVGLVAAFLCWQKALYIPVVLVVLAAWLPDSSGRTPGLRRALRRHRRLWTVLGVTSAAYVVLYAWMLRVNSTNYNLAGLPGLGESAELAWLTVRNFSVSVFGGPWQWDRPILAVPDPPQVLALASVVGLGALLVWCWRSRRRAVAFWLLVGGLLAADLALVVFGRLGNLGDPVSGSYLRYLADLAIPTTLALAFTFMAPRPEVPPTVARSDRSPTVQRRLLGVAAVAAVAVSAAVSSAFLLREWSRHPGAPYLDNLRADLASGPPPPLIVQQVPPGVIGPLFAPFNRTPVVFTVLDEDAVFVDHVSAPGALTGIRPDGTIGPVEVGPTPLTPVWSSAPAPEACGWPLTATPTDIPLVTVDPGGPVPAGSLWYGQVGVESDSDRTVDVVVGSTRLRAEVPAGSSQLYFPVVGPADSIRLRVEGADGEVCVGSVQVGQLVAASG